MHESPRSDLERRRIATAAVGALCALWFVGSLWITHGYYPAPPDALHQGIVARNLARGDGFTIGMVPFHVGRFANVEHVSELHAILQPVALAVLFALAGPEQSLLRVPGFLYVALTGFVAFVYGRRAFGTGAGLAACALTLSSSLLWVWAWFGTDDAGFAFWFLLSVYALDVALERRSGRQFFLAGLVAGAALLQKLSGLIIFAPLLAIALERGAPLRSRLRWVALWLAPWSLALALNMLRNRLASGDWGFRFGPIAWIYKAYGIEAYFGVHETLPSLTSLLRSIGSERLLEIELAQLSEFARALSLTPVFMPDPLHRLMTPAFLAIGGIAALALVARRRPRFAALAALSLLGSIGFVCVVWHYETRYFTLLVPLLAIAMGGAIATGASAANRLGGAALAVVTAGIGIGAVALSVGVFALSLKGVPMFGGPLPCRAAFDWIERETAPNARILTLDPWNTSWAADRSTIVVPSGSRADVEKIVAWYQPTWLFVQPEFARPESTRRIQEMLADPTDAFTAAPAFVDGDCAVYRITTSASEATPASR